MSNAAQPHDCFTLRFTRDGHDVAVDLPDSFDQHDWPLVNEVLAAVRSVVGTHSVAP